MKLARIGPDCAPLVLVGLSGSWHAAKGNSERLERRIERDEELMELNRTAFDRNTQALERMMALLDRHEQMFEENKKAFLPLSIAFRPLEAHSHPDAWHNAHMNRDELSELSGDWQTIRDEIRQSDERIDAALRELAESIRGHAGQTDGLAAAMEADREEPRAFRRELRERIDRLPPAQAA